MARRCSWWSARSTWPTPPTSRRSWCPIRARPWQRHRRSFYDDPSRALSLVGVTGTNGKTTTTYLVEHIARVAGKRTGVIGTVGTVIGDVHEKSSHTTPESPDLQHLLARMRDARCDVVAMEVSSSHALDLERTCAIVVRGHGVLQPDAGPPRLPSHLRGLLRGEGAPVHARTTLPAASSASTTSGASELLRRCSDGRR